MKKVFILGAGASADFSPDTYSMGYKLNKGSFEFFPTTNDFIQKAIKLEKIRSNYPLFELIKKTYNIDFESLKKGTPLNIEELYRDIDELFENANMTGKSEETGRVFALVMSIQDLIQEIPQHYSTVYGICENYSVFAKYIGETNSSVISFNWDTFLDEALSKTGKWFYESDYGFEFEKIYLDRQEIKKEGKNSSILLLKPHGSINWFRYGDHYSSTKDGFTGEHVSDDERKQTFLMLFSKNKGGIHPIHKRLNIAKGWKPNLKMPCGLDIIYPAKKNKSGFERINYFKINEEMKKCFNDADEIIFIGFALKPDDQAIFRKLQIKKSAQIIIVNKEANSTTAEIFGRYKNIFNCSNVKISQSKTFKEYCKSLQIEKTRHESNGLYWS